MPSVWSLGGSAAIPELVEAPRIDGVDVDVGPRRRGNRIPRLADEQRAVPAPRHVGGRFEGPAGSHRVPDVEVDPLADEHDGLPPAVNGRQPVGQVLHGRQHRAGVIQALRLIRVDESPAHTRLPAPVVVVDLVQRSRAQLASHEFVDRLGEEAPAVREVLRRVRPPARVDHGRQVVRPEVPFDELLPGPPHAYRALRVGVDVVQQQDVQASLGPAHVRLHVGVDVLRLEERPFRSHDWNVDQGKRRHGLGLPVFEDLEVLLLEIADERALPVKDDGVHFDVVHLGAEGNRRHLRIGPRLGLLARGWRLLAGEAGEAGGGKDESDGDGAESGHSHSLTGWAGHAACPFANSNHGLDAGSGSAPLDYRTDTAPGWPPIAPGGLSWR
jgi:hypothetical protein